jgi:penicillin-binding protein 1B
MLASVKRRVPAPVKWLASRMTRPSMLIGYGLTGLILAVVSFHYYSVFSAEIDARLQSGFFDNSATILSSPIQIKVGDKLSRDWLVGYLNSVGYHDMSASDPASDAGSFSIKGGAIRVIPRKTVSSNSGFTPVEIDLDKDGRVVRLTDPGSGQAAPSALIEGELLASVTRADRSKKTVIQLSDVPASLRNAVLAAEDRRFFSHSGVDCMGIARALCFDLRHGEIAQGGSTITQQLIKNSFLTRERSWARKVKEAAMALILESRLSKSEIFELYCNDIYLGQSGTFAINGFGEGAQVYFDKNVRDLSLAESAFLAGMIHAPNRYSAHRDPLRAMTRRSEILDAMVESGAISDEQAEVAKQEPLQIKKHEAHDDYGASYFVDYVQRLLEERRGSAPLASPECINTTLDLRLQRAAYDSVLRHTARLDRLQAKPRKNPDPAHVQAALVAIDAHTGDVLAMVGGRSYDESQLNRATDALRQPGSTFKPFVYASALSMRSYTAATTLSDRPQTFEYDGGRQEYKPSNYHGGFTNRDVTLSEALARSLNVPAVELSQRVGLTRIADLAESCGLPRPQLYPSMALGTAEVTPLQLAAAYTAFDNGGMALRPVSIKSIYRAKGLTSSLTASSSSAFSPQVAYLMTTLMANVVNEGTASRVRTMGLKGAIAGKTGTSRDGWFVGYTPRLVCAVWVGFDDNRDLGMTGSESALPIWVDFVKQAIEMHPELGGATFSEPGGMVFADIDPTTGLLASPECSERRRVLFIAGTEPFFVCTHESPTDAVQPDSTSEGDSENESISADEVTVEVCAETGLLASPVCPSIKRINVDRRSAPVEKCGPEYHR